jgi:N-acetylmuramoyl-L-alanine amidase
MKATTRDGATPLYLVLLVCSLTATAPLLAASAGDLYREALSRERGLRVPADTPATLSELRRGIERYEAIVRQYPRSGYSDNALWQAAGLALEAYDGYGEVTDQQRGERLLRLLVIEYPSSSLVPRVGTRLAAFGPVDAETPAVEALRADFADLAKVPLIEPVDVVVDAMPGSEEPSADAPQVLGLDLFPVSVGWVSRPLAPIASRGPVEAEEGLAVGGGVAGPTTDHIVAMVPEDDRAWPRDHDLLYPNLGTPPATLTSEAAPRTTRPTSEVAEVMPTSMAHVSMADVHEPIVTDARVELLPDVHEPAAVSPAPPAVVPTDAPSLTADGDYSLGRQLGLGISRVVIDPGHGGYDPGARSGELTEAALVLDVAERLESKLVAEGIEVVLTRRGDVYVSLRARTELANRVEADLFLSIHANAAEDPEARGIETYYLDFATDPTAKAVAALENAASGDHMHDLSDLVRSIAMNNKIDESRELARVVQRDLVAAARQSRPDAQDLGVKQAPFMVLIGATMPSVLTEISFLTNEDAAAHLATSVYRAQIAEALFASVIGYQRALKPATRVAANDDFLPVFQRFGRD